MDAGVVGSGNFLGFKILNFNFLGGSQKKIPFFGMKILWIFLGGHHKTVLNLVVNPIHFRVFFKVKI